MKWLLFLCLTISFNPARAQDEIDELAKSLTASCRSDEDKVKKIFHWITDNIAYRTKQDQIKVIGAASRRFVEEIEDDASPLKPLNERVAETVLRTRIAVCDGYARLFTVLCERSGLRSAVIIGYARGNNNKPAPRFGVNHYWNAVFLNGSWQLLDATWASGFVTRDGKTFVRSYDEDYFLADPKRFIMDHFPDDPRWTLLPDSGVPDEFRHSPFKQKSFVKYSITSFHPAKGVIEAAVGDIIRLELETADSERDKSISPDLLIDSTLFTGSASWIFLEPLDHGTGTGRNKRLQYSYKVESEEVEWLYLKYNSDLVLRYKINVRKKKT